MTKGWIAAKLSDVCGISSALVDPRRAEYVHMPHVGGANIESTTGRLIDLKTAKEEGLKSGKFVFDEQTVLYSKIRPYLKKVARPDFRGLCSADIYPLSPVEDRLDRGFLFHLLLTPALTDYAITGSARAGMPKVNRDHLFDFEFLLPPLPEQERIVRIVDKALESIATAKANSEKNLQNARAIFDSHLETVFVQSTHGSFRTRLGLEIDLLAGFAFKSSGYTESEEGVWLLRGDNIMQRAMRWEDVKKWPSADTNAFERYALRENDVVLAMDRPWIKAGLKHAMVSRADLPCLLVQRTARLRPGPRMDNRFLLYLIGSEAFSRHILGVQTGIGVPHISGQQIADFSFQLPPLHEQGRMVRQLDHLWGDTQRLASIYQQKVTALDALKKSLLHEAFSGNL